MVDNYYKLMRQKLSGSHTIKIILLCMFTLMLIPLISSAEFDNKKSFDKDIGDYGKVEIRNSVLGFSWWELGKVSTLELKTNTELCYEDCEANQEIIMYEDGKLIDDIRFVDLKTGKGIDIKGYDLKIKIDNEWRDYNYEVVSGSSKGISYEFKIEGELNPFQSVDWQIKSQGIWITEWAEWSDPLSVSLIAYWNFEQDASNLTLLEDVTGEGWKGTLNNTPTWNIGGGIIGDSITFSNITDDQVYINDILTFNTTNITLSFWQKRAGVEVDAVTMTYFSANKNNANGHDILGRNNLLQWGTAGSGVDVGMGANTLGNGSWHHIVIVRANTTGNNIYIDGVAQTLSNNNSQFDNDATIRSYIGSQPNGLVEDMNGDIDEMGIWHRALTAAEVAQLFNNGVGITFPIDAVDITLNSPADTFSTINNSILFNCSSEAINGVNNLTLLIDGSSNFTITNSSSFQNLSLQILVTRFNISSHNWTCRGVDGVNSTTTGVTRTFEIKSVVVNNQSFNNLTNEGATETFSINFTKTPTLQVSSVNLIYNETSNSFPYLTSENQVISESTIAIPAQDANVNITFFWNIIFSDDSSFNTTPNNQTVSIISLDNCGVFSNLVYNFTQYDEQTKVAFTQNNTIEIQLNLYDNSKTLLISNFSEKFTETNPVQICVEEEIISGVSYSAYVVAQYFANQSVANQSHALEYYNILNQSISNDTIPINIALYDLKEETTTKFRLTFRDASYVLAPNILVQIHRQYIEDNDFKIVEIPLTDSNGQTIMNLVRNNVVYNFIMVDEAQNVVATFNQLKVFCQDFTIDQCTILLAPDGESEDIFDYNEEFGVSVTAPSYNNITQRVSMSFFTDDLQPKSVRMDVFRNNEFGNRSVCTDSLTAASGLLSCDVSNVVDTDQFLFIYFYVEDELANQGTINLNASTLNFGIVNGAFYAFLIILFLITLFMEDKKVLVVSLGLGWVVIISLGLLNGSLVGATSAGIWILITIGIFIWKLNKDETL